MTEVFTERGRPSIGGHGKADDYNARSRSRGEFLEPRGEKYGRTTENIRTERKDETAGPEKEMQGGGYKGNQGGGGYRGGDGMATAAATVIEEVIATEVVTEVVSEEATEVATEEVEGVSSKALMFPKLLKGRHLNSILIISGSALEMFQGIFSYIRLISAPLTRRTASLSSEASDLNLREFSSSI